MWGDFIFVSAPLSVPVGVPQALCHGEWCHGHLQPSLLNKNPAYCSEAGPDVWVIQQKCDQRQCRYLLGRLSHHRGVSRIWEPCSSVMHEFGNARIFCTYWDISLCESNLCIFRLPSAHVVVFGNLNRIIFTLDAASQLQCFLWAQHSQQLS